MDDDVKTQIENSVLPEDIEHKVLSRFARKYGARAALDFIKLYEEEYPHRKLDKRRYLHIPTLKTVTQKAHSRLFD